MGFTANAPYQPTGDQPKAIRQLVDGVRQGMRYQTLLGATGTGKTAVMSWVFEELQRPALVLAQFRRLVTHYVSAETKDKLKGIVRRKS